MTYQSQKLYFTYKCVLETGRGEGGGDLGVSVVTLL